MAEAKIRITADTRQAEAALGNIDRALSGLQRTSGLVSTALGGLVAAFSAGALIKFSDEVTSVRNRLNQLADTQEGVNAQFNALVGIALSARTPLSQTADLYFRIAKNADALGISQREAATITQSVSKAITAAGISAQESSGALLQLGQALQSGRFQGDELRSILENLPPVANALAKSLGVPIGALKELGSQGRITAQDFVKAMREAKDSIDQDFARTIPTISQSFEQLRTSFALAFDRFEQGTQTSQSLSRAIQIAAGAVLLFADNIDKLLPYIQMTIKALLILGSAMVIGKVVTGIVAMTAAVRVAVMTLGGWVGLLIKAGAAVAAFLGVNALSNELSDTGDAASFASKALEALNKAQQDHIDKLSNTAGAGAAAYDAKLIENQRKALEDRNKALKDAQTDLQQNLVLAGLEGVELEKQSQLYSINKSLIKEIKNERGETVAYTEGLTDAERRNLAITMDQISARRLQTSLARDLNTAVAESLRINIQDLNLREQQAAVDARRLDLGRALTDQEEAQVRAIVRQNQANREALAIDEARRKLTGASTRIESIQRGVGVVGRVNPNEQLAQEYKLDLDSQRALLDAKLINEQQYQENVYKLREEYNNRANELYIQQVANEKAMKQTQIQAEQQRLGKTAEQARTYAEFEMKTTAEKTQFAMEQGAQIFSALGAQNKKAFEAAKAFNIANAVMNTYMAVTKALASYPFPFSLIAAGGALAFGLAQVAQIRSQQYSGRQLGGPVMGGQSYLVGENGPELFTPNTTGGITRNNDLQAGGTTNINFTIVANDAQGFDDLLLQRRGMITQMIADAQLERGMRAL